MRVLALTEDGRLTYCVSPEDQRGKGRCNHVAHQKEGQSVADFIGEIKDNSLNDSNKKDLEAIRQDGQALKFVQNQTPEICMEAVKQNGMVLQYVQNQTPEICIEAVKQNGWALKYVQDQTPEIIQAALEQEPYAIEFVKI